MTDDRITLTREQVEDLDALFGGRHWMRLPVGEVVAALKDAVARDDAEQYQRLARLRELRRED